MGNRSAIEKEADGGILAIAHMVCFPSWRSLLRGAPHEGLSPLVATKNSPFGEFFFKGAIRIRS